MSVEELLGHEVHAPALVDVSRLQPFGTPDARSPRKRHATASRPAVVERASYLSLNNVLQHLLVQGQISKQLHELIVLLFEALQLPDFGKSAQDDTFCAG